MESATILMPPSTGLSGILYCSKRYKVIGIQRHQRVIFDITSHPNENRILSMLRGSIPMDLS